MRHNATVLYVCHWPAYLVNCYCCRVGTNDAKTLHLKREIGGATSSGLRKVLQLFCHVILGKDLKMLFVEDLP
jgi:hypothetical protein